MATLKGKWLFNETITVPGADIEQAVNFATAGTIEETLYTALNCTSMLVDVSSIELLKYKVDSATPKWEYNPAYYGAYVNGLAGFYGFYEDAMRTVDFGDTEQEVSDEFDAWFTANAVRQGAEGTSASTITYNGNIIAALLPGQTATLHCAGKPMTTDVVVAVGEIDVPVLQEKIAIENGEVTPDAGYDGLSKVTVNVSDGTLMYYEGAVTML